MPPNDQPFTADAFDGEVVITAAGPGRGVDLAMTPEAVLASLEPLRVAAEAALAQSAAAAAAATA